MWLVVGGDSEIGGAIVREFEARGEQVVATTRRVERVSTSRVLLDLARSPVGWQPPKPARAACFCAAVARLADCANDPAGSRSINVAQTAAWVDHLRQLGTSVVFLSTNQVFDGRRPHVAVGEPTCPTSEYGKQKATAEGLLRASKIEQAPVSILRLAKVVDERWSLLQHWRERLSKRQPVEAFYDMMLAPVLATTVAAAVTNLMEDRASGTFQLSGPQDLSYAEVAKIIAAEIERPMSLVAEVSALAANLPIGSTPLNTTMDSSVLEALYGIAPASPTEVVRQLLLR